MHILLENMPSYVNLQPHIQTPLSTGSGVYDIQREILEFADAAVLICTNQTHAFHLTAHKRRECGWSLPAAIFTCIYNAPWLLLTTSSQFNMYGFFRR